MGLHKYIYLVGERLRNPLIRKKLSELMKSDFASYEQLEAEQLGKLKQLLSHAKKHSPYYREKLKDLDIETFTLDKMHTIPLLSKTDLYAFGDKIYNNPYGEKLIKSETSGSTGDALIFYRTREWDAVHRAAQYRGYSWYDIHPWDKNIYFWGFNPNWKQKIKIRFLDFLLNRYRIFTFSDKKVIEKAAKLLQKCRYIEGYSSAVFELSRQLHLQDYHYDHIKLVKGTSEKIYPSYHDMTKAVFGKVMTSEYGAAETGIIAFECPHGHMHTVMENVIIEEIENKIVVTNLYSYSFPIIRYELGDYIKLSDVECPCGRQHTVIEEVTGRIGKKIVGYHSEYPTLTLYYIFKNIALVHKVELAYFATQYEKGKLVIEILLPKEKEEILKNYVLEEGEKYFQGDIDIKVKFIYELERKKKKIKDFESYLQ